MKWWFQATLLLLTSLSLPFKAGAQEEPIAVFHSTAYESQGEENVVTILFGGIKQGEPIIVDDGNQKQTIILDVTQIDSETGTWTGSVASCNVSSEGYIKVYGDASKINLINASGCKIDRADITQLTTLNILDLSHNELKALNMDGLTNMQALYLNDNPFSETPLKVGNDKAKLLILDIGQVEQLDPSFALTDYPELVSFDAWHCSTLTKVDPTGCPNLQRLSIDTTPVKELDITKNAKLAVLNISETGINKLDLSQSPYLQELYCDHVSGSMHQEYKLRELDITKNIYLTKLFASGNLLESIDLTQNKYLTDIFLNYNKLSSIDISNNPNITKLMLRNNHFDFATLPLPQDTWVQYEYMQMPMQVDKSYPVGATIDLSKRVLREDFATEAAVYKTSDENPSALTLLDESYYRYENGKITLLKETAGDSIYVAFACEAFPELDLNGMPLKTEKFVVKNSDVFGKEELAFSLTPATTNASTLNLGINIHGATAENPKTFYVDFGDGQKKSFVSNGQTAETANVTTDSWNGTINIYVQENDKVSAIHIHDIALKDIQLDRLHELQELHLTNTQMKSIDLGWNRCLQVLEITGNDFDSLNIRGANDAFQKNLLQTINLSNNKLTKVTLNDNYTIHHLNLSHNLLTELSFKDGDMMESINVSDNLLTSINLDYCTILKELNIANNHISSMAMPAEHLLNSVHCEGNELSFTTLPNIQGINDFVYAPQADIVIADKGPGADLSAHNLNNQTVYTWKNQEGDVLTANTDYTLSDGRTHFLEPVIGQQLYCEMTHPDFSDLTIKTTTIEAMDMPTHELGHFTMTADSTATLILRALAANTNIGIDWKGDGTDFEQFVVDTNPCTFTVKGRTGATARVYAYSDKPGLTVFNMTGMPMKEADFSNMTELTTLTLKNAGLYDIALPNSEELFELTLDGSHFSSLDVSRYTKLVYLMLNDNEFTTFDASIYPNLQLLGLGNNKLTDIKLDNANLWSLVLSGNQLESIDFSKAKSLYQVGLDYNKLSQLNVSMLKDLRVLFIDHNRFKFSTLPVNKNYSLYTYANQDPVEISSEGGIVDLSSEASIYGIETEYRWFVDMPYIDEAGELTGEELFIDEEYRIENGITYFLKPEYDVMCVMTNSNFPDLYLITTLIDVKDISQGIDRVENGNPESGDYEMYNLHGAMVKKNSSNLKAGLYLMKKGNKTEKVIVQ